MDDGEAFSRYAHGRLNAVAFASDFDKADEQIFAASLASFEGLSGWANGMVNASGQQFEVVPGYVETMTPNAFADIHDGRHFIGLHQALIVTIIDFALYALTQSRVFPLIGNAAGEDSPPPVHGEAPGLFLLDLTIKREDVETDTDRHRVPKDATRHVMAVYLAMLMTRFVWLHELAHCVGGHVLFLQHHSLAARLNEVPDPAGLVGFKQPAPDAAIVALKLAMELDADATALFGACQIQLTNGENIPGIAALPLPLRIEMTILGAYLMAWLFEEYQRHMETRDAVTHPAPRERLAHLIAMIQVELAGMIDDFDAIHDRVTAQFNALAEQIPAMPRLDGAAIPIQTDLAILESALAPFRFQPATGQTAD